METRLKELRKQSGLSQEQLAEAMSISKYQIRTYEQGTRDMSVSTMISFCNFFKCTTDRFLATGYDEGDRQELLITDDDEKNVIELWRGLNDERKKDILLLMNRWQ